MRHPGRPAGHAPMSLSLKRAAEKLIKGGEIIGDGLLNRIEMSTQNG